MRRALLTLTVMLLIIGHALAAPVKYRSGSETVSAYLAVPTTKGPHPAIVVIHEWWGLNPWVMKQADQLAKQGYVALAVDLYRGKVAKDTDEAHELSRGLPRDRAMRDLQAALTFLASRPDVDRNRLGSIGWCMGGGWSLDLALADKRVKACVMAYGSPKSEAAALQSLNGPVLGVFGTEDRGINPDTVRQFWAAMSAAKKHLELHEMLGVGHAFMNPNNKAGYNPAATAVASMAIRIFLLRELAGGKL